MYDLRGTHGQPKQPSPKAKHSEPKQQSYSSSGTWGRQHKDLYCRYSTDERVLTCASVFLAASSHSAWRLACKPANRVLRAATLPFRPSASVFRALLSLSDLVRYIARSRRGACFSHRPYVFLLLLLSAEVGKHRTTILRLFRAVSAVRHDQLPGIRHLDNDEGVALLSETVGIKT